MEKIRGLIKPEEAKKMSENFTARCELISERILGKQDNRSSWWSLKDIRNYLDYAERQAKEQGYEMTGIRVYCGAHEKLGYSTAFIVPTANIPNGKDGDGDRHSDIPDGEGLNDGQTGDPPGNGYPQ